MQDHVLLSKIESFSAWTNRFYVLFVFKVIYIKKGTYTFLESEFDFNWFYDKNIAHTYKKRQYWLYLLGFSVLYFNEFVWIRKSLKIDMKIINWFLTV